MGYILITLGQTVSYRSRANFIFRVVAAVAYVILLWPVQHLLNYTSPGGVIGSRYSIAYFGLLVIYAGVVLLWSFFLMLPDRYLDHVTGYVAYILEYQFQLFIRFIAIVIGISLLAPIFLPLWAWGQSLQLQFNLVLMGLWVSLGPLIWKWGVGGWQVRWLSPDHLYFWLKENLFLWLSPLSAVGVVLIGTRLGFLLELKYWLIVSALFPVAILGWALWRWRFLAVITLPVASLIIPFEIKAGSEYSKLHAVILLIMLLTGFWVLDMIRARQILLPRSKTVLPLVVFAAIVLLAFGFGQLAWYPLARPSMAAQIGGAMIFILSFLALLLVAVYIRELRWLQWMTWLFIGLGGVYILARLWPTLGAYISPKPSFNWQDNIGRFQPQADGSMFWTWLVALSFSQAVFNHQLQMRWRVVSGGVALATLYFGLFINNVWVSGYAPPLVAVGVIMWVGAPQLAAIGTFVASGGVIWKLQQLLTEMVFVGDNSYSLATRGEARDLVLSLSKVSPIIGLGPSNYYYYTPLFPIRGYFVRFNSHNQLVDLIAQTGILGLLCFFWTLGSIGWLGWKLRNRVPDGFARAYVYGTLGGLAGTVLAALLGDWVLPFTYNVGLTGMRASIFAWIFMGGLVALEQMVNQSVVAGQFEAK